VQNTPTIRVTWRAGKPPQQGRYADNAGPRLYDRCVVPEAGKGRRPHMPPASRVWKRRNDAM